MNLYRNTTNQKLYTIEYLILDNKHLNCNAFSGIYAKPFDFVGEIIKHTKQMFEDGLIDEFNPLKFVKENFEIVAELSRL
jgi:hypothetical protein